MRFKKVKYDKIEERFKSYKLLNKFSGYKHNISHVIYRGEIVGLVCYNEYRDQCKVIDLLIVLDEYKNAGITAKLGEYFKSRNSIVKCVAQNKSVRSFLLKNGFNESARNEKILYFDRSSVLNLKSSNN